MKLVGIVNVEKKSRGFLYGQVGGYVNEKKREKGVC